MAVEQTAGTNWGVTVEEVSALTPHVSIGITPAVPVDPVFGATADRRISVDEVEQFISDVAGRVALRLAGLDRVTDPTRAATLGKAAHDATVNGAASYLIAAAFSVGQTNSSDSYRDLLWARYESALDGADTALTAWLDELPPVVPPASGSISSFFPAPMFPDGARY
jgi:hypothetical protein